MSEFIDFITYRCQYLYSNNTREGKFGEKGNVHRNQVNDYSKGSKIFVTSNETCFLCKQPRQIFQCRTFIEMPIQSKRDEVKKANLCWNCLCCTLCKIAHPGGANIAEGNTIVLYQ